MLSFGHCIVCPIYASDYLFGIFKLLVIALSVLLFMPLITSLVFFGHCIVCPSIYCLWLPLWYLLVIVLSALWFSASDYLFGIFWSLYCLSFYLLPLIISLVSFGHCIVCPSIYASDYLFGNFKLLVIVLSVLLFMPLITSLASSNFSSLSYFLGM
jgi:hypothetical protein